MNKPIIGNCDSLPGMELLSMGTGMVTLAPLGSTLGSQRMNSSGASLTAPVIRRCCRAGCSSAVVAGEADGHT